MRSWVAMLVVLTACGNVGATREDANVPGDAAGPDASSADASAVCDPTAKFDAPVPLEGINLTSFKRHPRLTADELELYFSGNLGSAADDDIIRVQRSAVAAPFGAPVSLSSLNTTLQDGIASISPDGLTLFFESNRVTGEGFHLYVSTRASRVAEFGVPAKVANVNSAITSEGDGQPFVTADGQELWFASGRAGGLGLEDIYHARRNGPGFGEASPALEP